MYEFLSYLQRSPSPTCRLEIFENGFFPVAIEDISRLDEKLGFQLPSQLKVFYQEIGEGRLQTGSCGGQADFNNVASPSEVIAILEGTSDWLMPYSKLEPGVLPFFQRDVDLFLCLHPKSDNPNAVWWMWGEKMPNGGKICDSLVEFFQRLVEDPNWFNPPKS